MKPNHDEISVGPTTDLSLRVSVATLVRVVFPSEHRDGWLALERKATFRQREQDVIVKAQPFGGAVRINDLARIREITGSFHFDSERSRVEKDFRIFARPSAWEEVKAYCLNQFQASNETAFETSPARELAEELYDSLGIELDPHQYSLRPMWTVLENELTAVRSIRAAYQPTVRIYRVFEGLILDSVLWQAIRRSSERVSDQDLRGQVLEDHRINGKGRANACIILSMENVRQFCQTLSPAEAETTLSYAGTILEDNISALWDNVPNSKFQYIAD